MSCEVREDPFTVLSTPIRRYKGIPKKKDCVSSQMPQYISIIRYGLVVRISGSHPGGPGSIPGNGILFHKYFQVLYLQY